MTKPQDPNAQADADPSTPSPAPPTPQPPPGPPPPTEGPEAPPDAGTGVPILHPLPPSSGSAGAKKG